MPYFSRLTDIVTCNLSTILDKSDDHKQALEEIISEMNEGVAGAQRSVNTANDNVSKIEVEIGEQRQQVDQWQLGAADAIQDGDESKARHALARKHEVEDLIAGLEQQLAAAVSTRDHLNTIFNALQARLADAKRRLRLIESGEDSGPLESPTKVEAQTDSTPNRQSRVDAELEALRKQLGSS